MLRFGNSRRVLALSLAIGLVPAMAWAGDIEDAVLAELNAARTDPQAYARKLEAQPVSDWESRFCAPARAREPAAHAEAVAFLKRQKPLPPFRRDDRLVAAAVDHAAAQVRTAAFGHQSADGEAFDERLQRHGVKAALMGENLVYGPPTAADVVRQLVIDRGVPSRAHRNSLFQTTYTAVGVGCGAHPRYGMMCVVDMSGGGPAGTWRQAAR